MAAAASTLPRTDAAGAHAVYFPTCLTRVLGPRPDEPSSPTVVEAVLAVSARAGRPLHLPPDAPGHCCGMPFASKGYFEAAHDLVNALVRRLWAWSDEGRLAVVVDTSSCAQTLRTCREDLTPENRSRYDRLRIGARRSRSIRSAP
jgi:D-lactate dehydrogenase